MTTNNAWQGFGTVAGSQLGLPLRLARSLLLGLSVFGSAVSVAAPPPQAVGPLPAPPASPTDAQRPTAGAEPAKAAPPPAAPAVPNLPVSANPNASPGAELEPEPAPLPVLSASQKSEPAAHPSAATTPGQATTELDLFRVEEAVRLQVPIVVTASRQEESATEAPATTIVITREEIRQRGYSFLKDVLRDQPGLETEEYHFSEWGTLVPVRGVVGNNKIIVLINGMRVNPPGGEAMMLRSDISVRDAEQVEIVYGPGSTLYGQDAISAVINIITTKAKDDNVHISKAEARRRLLEPVTASERLASLGVEFGYPLQKEIYGHLNLRFGQARFYGSVHYLDKELTDLSSAYPEVWSLYQAQGAGKDLPLQPRRYDTGLNLLFRVEYDKTAVQLWHRQSARSSSEAYGLPPILGYVDQARWSDMSTVAEVRNTLPIGKYFSLESILTFNRYEVQPDTRYVFLDAAPAPGQPQPWFLNDFKYARGTSGSLEERLVFRLASRLSVVGGLFVAHYDVTPKSTVPGGADRGASIPEQGGAFTYYTSQGDSASLVNLPRVAVLTYQDFGGYLEANWKIFKLLRLIVGLRLDKNTRVEELAFSPRAALIFNYKSLSLKYLFSRAFVAPAPYFSYNVYFNGASINTANQNLSPEISYSNEFNIAFNNKYVSIGASAYYNLQQNLLIEGDRGLSVNLIQKVWLDPQGTQEVELTHSANAGNSQAIGTDIYGKWNVWKLSGWASYSYTNFVTVLEDKSTPMQGISAHNFRLGLTASILKNLHATASLMLRSTPENLKSVPELDGLVGLPWDLNFHLLYSPLPSIDIYADLRNFTNHAYYLGSVGGSPYPVQTIQGSGGVRFSF